MTESKFKSKVKTETYAPLLEAKIREELQFSLLDVLVDEVCAYADGCELEMEDILRDTVKTQRLSIVSSIEDEYKMKRLESYGFLPAKVYNRIFIDLEPVYRVEDDLKLILDLPLRIAWYVYGIAYSHETKGQDALQKAYEKGCTLALSWLKYDFEDGGYEL